MEKKVIDVEILQEIHSKEIDWEAREWSAAVAIMAQCINNQQEVLDAYKDTYKEHPHVDTGLARVAIDFAKTLVAEYKKKVGNE